MLIGELAAVVGVSTRAIRHYHRIGLLPEPARRANRYRTYTVRDAVRLARIRQLIELGLSLDETRDALAEDDASGLPDILARLEADLDRQERELRERRHRLRLLLENEGASTNEPISALSRLIQDAFPDSAAARRDRDYLTVLDRRITPELATYCRTLLADPRLVAQLAELYRRFDEIAEAASADPRVAALAADLVRLVPAELAALIRSPDARRHPIAAAVARELPPAHARLLEHLFELWRLPG